MAGGCWRVVKLTEISESGNAELKILDCKI